MLSLNLIWYVTVGVKYYIKYYITENLKCYTQSADMISIIFVYIDVQG